MVTRPDTSASLWFAVVDVLSGEVIDSRYVSAFDPVEAIAEADGVRARAHMDATGHAVLLVVVDPDGLVPTAVYRVRP